MARSEKGRKPEPAFVPLRCPGCGAQVNVQFAQRTARCSMCGTGWEWKRAPKRMTLTDEVRF